MDDLILTLDLKVYSIKIIRNSQHKLLKRSFILRGNVSTTTAKASPKTTSTILEVLQNNTNPLFSFSLFLFPSLFENRIFIFGQMGFLVSKTEFYGSDSYNSLLWWWIWVYIMRSLHLSYLKFIVRFFSMSQFYVSGDGFWHLKHLSIHYISIL